MSLHTKVIRWNIQGLKKSQVSKEIKLLIRHYKSDMLFLIKTMVNDKNTLSILPTLGFDRFEYVLPSNHSGGLVVLWNNGVIHVSVLFTEPRAIHILVHDTINTKTTVVSGVYAPAQTPA